MKKLFLLIYTLSLVSFNSLGQTPLTLSKIKVMKLSNEIYDLISDGKIEKAVNNSIQVNEMDVTLLISDLHANTCKK